MTGMRWNYLGADGSSWDLTNGPVRLDKRPVEGVGDPEWTRSVRTAAGRHGQRRTAGSLAKGRTGFIPFWLADTDPATRVATERAWWAAWDPDTTGVLSITQPDGSVRSITVNFADDDDYATEKDPYTRPTDKLGVNWIADNPWWRGPVVQQSFGQSTASSFFGTRAGPPFSISSSNVLATATLTNPGDIEAAVRTTINGPATAFDSAINGHHVTGPISVASGQQLILDSDVQQLAATLVATDGSTTDVTPQLTAWDFARIPPKSTVPLALSLTGSGSVTVRFYPLYKRAW